ncbi:Cytochrome c-type biogenesis protein CcmH [Rhodocyclaceae bacterium]|jgi:cytochrome c-type biogenesis protein CcmH|nr:Cytochrome c-type biogenesis protein CcmH [Rhodocyclaceae bacterium]
MRRLFLILSLLIACSPGYAREAAPTAADVVVEKRMVAISEELRCLVCQNESLAGSQADLAKDLRREIREQIAQGKSDKEILDFMTGRYGDFVRYRPPLKGTTFLLWFGPFLLLVAGIAALGIILRRRGKRVAEATLSAEEQKRAEALLSLGGEEKP